jgi:hypothetical protein
MAVTIAQAEASHLGNPTPFGGRPVLPVATRSSRQQWKPNLLKR